jgi:RNA recognition motif-containing protein
MSADDARKLFVGGLSDAVTEEELRGVFTGAGYSVAHLAMPRDRDTGRLRGFAFVTLGSEEEAQAARSKVQGMMCGGRPLSVREFSQGSQKSQPRSRGEEPTVFLGKLPFDATQEEIEQFFSSAGLGPVVRVTLPTGPDGRPRGFGFATLESQEAATQAVAELNGAALRGRNIVVSPAQPRGRTGGAPGRGTSPRRPELGEAPSYQSSNYQNRGPRAVPREPEPGFFPEEPPPFPPDDGEGRRRRTEPKKKERGASDRRRGGGGEGGGKTGKRRRGGASSWQQWDRDDD